MRDVHGRRIEEELEKRVQAGEFIAVDQEPGVPRPRSRREMVALERDTIRMMRAGQDSHPAMASVAPAATSSTTIGI